MSKFNRYKVAKMLHPDYVILLVVGNHYITYNNDLEIIRYIKFKNSFKVFDRYKINYLVLDELDITRRIEYDNNNYDRYLYIIMLDRIINNIGYNLSYR